jgi:putative transposase
VLGVHVLLELVVVDAVVTGGAGLGLARLHGREFMPRVYRWKEKYGSATVDEVRRLKQLEDENWRLKHLVADLTLDNQALRAVLAKKS